MYKTKFICKANTFKFSKDDLDEKVYRNLVKSQSQIDPEGDLLRMLSVLVSTGINKNDDVFIREEVLKARSSGANKPVNIEHDENKIIGNMTRTFVLQIVTGKQNR